MPRKFECEDEPNEFMEAPCRCDCGMWFDQEDGYRSELKPGTIICGQCHINEIDELRADEDW